jgi:SAM-dependent methyltransferase
VKDYTEHFNVRGSTYDRAMHHYPRARDQEFGQLVDRAQLRGQMTVGDVPAGGGYLQDYLPEGCTWRGYEPCATFNHNAPSPPSAASQPLLPLPWEDNSLDAAVSLAGVHHIDDKRPLMSEVIRTVRPGGRFVLSDVAEGTRVARFLDGFVGGHNSTGHEGVFLGDRTLAELSDTGWRIASCEQVHYHWIFEDRVAMTAFCTTLFDLRKASADMVEAAIEDILGVDILPSGETGMRWSLMTIVAEKPLLS